MGEAGRKIVMTKFTWQHSAAQLQNIIKTV
jgi:hypothetical protein